MKTRGFTLLEVMIAMAVLGIAMLALMGLQDQSMHSVIRGQEITRAAMLAQTVMAETELQRFPDLGQTHGNFRQWFGDQFPSFVWQRIVEPSGAFPDVRKVQVIVQYGPHLSGRFTLTEFMHSPIPLQPPGAQPSAMPTPSQ
jgi:general secretion pathway protein I